MQATLTLKRPGAFRAILWKELRPGRGTLLAAAAAVPLVLLLVFLSGRKEEVGTTMPLLAAIASLLVGAGLIAGEREAGSVEFAALLPYSRWRLWLAKVIPGVIQVLLICTIAAIVAHAARVPEARAGRLSFLLRWYEQVHVPLIFGLGLCFFGAGLLASTALSRGMSAFVLGAPVAFIALAAAYCALGFGAFFVANATIVSWLLRAPYLMWILFSALSLAAFCRRRGQAYSWQGAARLMATALVGVAIFWTALVCGLALKDNLYVDPATYVWGWIHGTSAHGRLMAFTAGAANGERSDLWFCETTTGRLSRPFQWHGVEQIAVSPGGTYLAARLESFGTIQRYGSWPGFHWLPWFLKGRLTSLGGLLVLRLADGKIVARFDHDSEDSPLNWCNDTTLVQRVYRAPRLAGNANHIQYIGNTGPAVRFFELPSKWVHDVVTPRDATDPWNLVARPPGVFLREQEDKSKELVLWLIPVNEAPRRIVLTGHAREEWDIADISPDGAQVLLLHKDPAQLDVVDLASGLSQSAAGRTIVEAADIGPDWPKVSGDDLGALAWHDTGGRRWYSPNGDLILFAIRGATEPSAVFEFTLRGATQAPAVFVASAREHRAARVTGIDSAAFGTFSPDSTRFLGQHESKLWLLDLKTCAARLLPINPGDRLGPVWWLADDRIVVQNSRNTADKMDLWSIKLDGTDRRQLFPPQ